MPERAVCCVSDANKTLWRKPVLAEPYVFLPRLGLLGEADNTGLLGAAPAYGEAEVHERIAAQCVGMQGAVVAGVIPGGRGEEG